MGRTERLWPHGLSRRPPIILSSRLRQAAGRTDPQRGSGHSWNMDRGRGQKREPAEGGGRDLAAAPRILRLVRRSVGRRGGGGELSTEDVPDQAMEPRAWSRDRSASRKAAVRYVGGYPSTLAAQAGDVPNGQGKCVLSVEGPVGRTARTIPRRMLTGRRLRFGSPPAQPIMALGSR